MVAGARVVAARPGRSESRAGAGPRRRAARHPRRVASAAQGRYPMTVHGKRIVLVVAAAASIFGLAFGLRVAQALYLSSINTETGVGLVVLSLAFAISQPMWGVAQPVAGAIADRYGAGRVIAGAIVLIALGNALIPFAHSPLMLIFAIGVVIAVGAGANGPSILLAAVNRLVPPERRAFASGIVNAGGSFGQFLLVPVAQGLLGLVGWKVSLWLLATFAVAMVPLAGVRRGKGGAIRGAGRDEPLGHAVKRALGDRSYLLLNAGFFTCGFHVAFIMTHLPGVVNYCGLPPTAAAWALSVIGLFNILGSIGAGWAMSRWRSKSLLALLYGTRALAVAVFLV